MIRVGSVPQLGPPGTGKGLIARETHNRDTLHVDNWRVHIVREGEKYGATKGLTHNKPDPLVEFYDTSGDPERFPGGQFVARYYADTLAYVKGGLNLQAGIAVWSLSAKQMQAVNAFLDREVRSCSPAGSATTE